MKTFLLCKESKFILEIIEHLHKAPSKELSFKELENYIGITKQTIKNYVETLLHYCKGKKLKGKLQVQVSHPDKPVSACFN